MTNQAIPAPPSAASSPSVAPAVVAQRLTGGEVLRYRLSKECTVEVAFSGAITQSAIDKLRAHLDLSKDAYPENGEIN